MAGFVNIFGGTAVSPSNVQYLSLALTANTTLVWPLESAEGQIYLAAQIDVTPSGGGFALLLPPANQGATGITSVITNLGASSFNLQNNGGGAVTTIAPGESWIVSLTLNTTVNGVWEGFKLGAGAPSGSIAAALAGPGLIAAGTQLELNIVTNSYSTNQSISTGHRATANIWTGTTGTFTLAPISTVTAGWFAIIANAGSGPLTLATSGGNTIDGQANIVIPVSGTAQPYSLLVVAAAGGFTTYFMPPVPTPVAAGGTGATTAGAALANLGGTTVGIDIFTAPSVAAILAILGITQNPFIESTIAVDRVLSSGDKGTVFVAAAPLTLTQPEGDTVGSSFYYAIYAQGGAVTVTPASGDAINGTAPNTPLIVAQGASLLMVNDGATPSNWWPLFLPIPSPSSNSIADMRARAVNTGLVGTTVYLLGYYTPGDGGGGNTFLITNVNPGADNGGTIIWSNTVGFYYVQL